jgi:molybdate transport system substrate-binding protein
MSLPKKIAAPIAAFLLVSGAFSQTARREVHVGAAANLSDVFRLMGPRFEAATGIHPVFSFASTAQLAMQIENGAPYDVFAAADVEHVDQLEKRGLLAPGSEAVYATGILALWLPPTSQIKLNNPGDVVQPGVRVIALAKPELAPYGQAARETLRELGIWNQVEAKIVYADSISMAKQYGASGNADAVFTALSLVLHEQGKVIEVNENLHRPIDQALGIVASSKDLNAARQFTEFLLNGKGRDILAASGYRVAVRPAQR